MWKCIICGKENLENRHECACGFVRDKNILEKRTLSPVCASDSDALLFCQRKHILEKMLSWQKHEKEELEKQKAEFERQKADFEKQKAGLEKRVAEADEILEKQRKKAEADKARREARKKADAASAAWASSEAAKKRREREEQVSKNLEAFYADSKKEWENRKANLVSNLDIAKDRQ
ncbi:MAG: hypothetical protein IJH99_06615 [Eubacterium sp.]|nr:hypothetical protein [Eubacterium sp.]